MKRAWFALILLLALLAAGIGITVAMDRIYEPVADFLEDASESAMAGDWHLAENKLHQAQHRWEEYRKLSAAAADHAPMEEISAWFARVEVYLKQKDRTGFSAGCMYLSQLVEAMGEAHEVSWWNLL